MRHTRNPSSIPTGAVLRRLGHKMALTLSMGSLGLYCVLYSQLVDPWYCLFMEPLAGGYDRTTDTLFCLFDDIFLVIFSIFL